MPSKASDIALTQEVVTVEEGGGEEVGEGGEQSKRSQEETKRNAKKKKKKKKSRENLSVVRPNEATGKSAHATQTKPCSQNSASVHEAQCDGGGSE